MANNNGTTPIFDLPSESVNNNISFNINDNNSSGGVSLDQTTINQIVSGMYFFTDLIKSVEIPKVSFPIIIKGLSIP